MTDILLLGDPTIPPEVRRAKQLFKAIEDKCGVRVFDDEEGDNDEERDSERREENEREEREDESGERENERGREGEREGEREGRENERGDREREDRGGDRESRGGSEEPLEIRAGSEPVEDLDVVDGTATRRERSASVSSQGTEKGRRKAAGELSFKFFFIIEVVPTLISF